MPQTIEENPTVVSALDLDPCKFGSIEEYTVELSRALRLRGWRSVLVFARPIPENVLPHFRDSGATIEVYEGKGWRGYIPSLYRILRKHRPKIVHFRYFEQFSLAPVMAWLAGAKIIIFTAAVTVPRPLKVTTKVKLYLWDRIILRLLKVRTIAVSEHVKRTLVDCYQMRPVEIRPLLNGINVKRFAGLSPDEISRIRQELKIPSNARVVLSPSNLRPEKGVDDLLLAAKQVLANRPETYFVVAGDGPMAGKLHQMAEDLAIKAQVRFTGTRSDLQRLMNLADIVVIPSTWQEPAGLVTIEAMGCERAVVATRVGGIPEYLGTGPTGILVDPHAPEQIAQAILKLLDSPADMKSIASAGHERVKSQFSMERWINETLRIYDEYLGIAP